jgi:hypothetical protein
MRWPICAAVVAVTALGLAGCGKDADKKAEGAIPGPARKAGLWEQTTNIQGLPTQVMRLCTNPKVDASLPWWGGVSAAGNCKPVSGKKNPDGSWSFESRCDLGNGGKAGLTGTGVGDFNTKYDVKILFITAGASDPKMNGRRELTNTMVWKGECPADFLPGDVEVAGGTRMNHDPNAVADEIARAKAALAAQEAAQKLAPAKE